MIDSEGNVIDDTDDFEEVIDEKVPEVKPINVVEKEKVKEPKIEIKPEVKLEKQVSEKNSTNEDKLAKLEERFNQMVTDDQFFDDFFSDDE